MPARFVTRILARPLGAILLAASLMTPLAVMAADEETPVPLPCNPEDCGPVPITLPGCPTCEPGPALTPGTAPGGPIE